MENPASAEFVDMKLMRENTFGQPFEVICGHVKGKKKSGESTGERPFLYLAMEEEAFIVGGNQLQAGDRVSRPLHQPESLLNIRSGKKLYGRLEMSAIGIGHQPKAAQRSSGRQ